MMNHIINTIDVQTLARPMSEHLDQQRLAVCIDEAERLDIVPTIGAELFLALLAGDGDFALLLNGGVWYDACGAAHLLKGLRAAAAYYAYARLLRLADGVLTRYGFVTKNDDYSARVDAADRERAVADARIVADGYLAEVVAYLNATADGCGCTFRRLRKYGRAQFTVIGE